MEFKKAYFGGGCFWCTETFFLRLRGVHKVVSGYAGGQIKNPTYKEICTGLTGHAELIEVSYDPEVITYKSLLDVFFNTHDPTTLNRQGNDVGTQYRSVIFYASSEERAEAQAFIDKEAKELWSNPIMTELSPLPIFYPAEAYHQNYFDLNPRQGYCRVVISPKLQKFSERFHHLLKSN